MCSCFRAALFNRGDIISFLLDHDVPFDTRDAQRSTPFLDAVAAGQTKCAQLLLQRGANIKASDIYLKNCIHMVVENEYLETLRMLLKESSVLRNLYRPDVKERVPLHYAAMVKDVKVTNNSNVSFKTALLALSLRTDIPIRISLEGIAVTRNIPQLPQLDMLAVLLIIVQLRHHIQSQNLVQKSHETPSIGAEEILLMTLKHTSQFSHLCEFRVIRDGN